MEHIGTNRPHPGDKYLSTPVSPRNPAMLPLYPQYCPPVPCVQKGTIVLPEKSYSSHERKNCHRSCISPVRKTEENHIIFVHIINMIYQLRSGIFSFFILQPPFAYESSLTTLTDNGIQKCKAPLKQNNQSKTARPVRHNLKKQTHFLTVNM